MKEMPKAPGTKGQFIGTTAGQGSVPLLAGGLTENPPGFTFERLGLCSYTLFANQIVGAPTTPAPCIAFFSSSLFGEGLRRFNGAKLVGHCDVVGIVSRLIRQRAIPSRSL